MQAQARVVQTPPMRIMPSKLRARKGGEPIVCLTAYTSWMARLLDEQVDLLLVGDSVGMVAHGFSSTLPVTLEMMAAHGAAVARAASHACVVLDLPFGSYQESKEQAFRTSSTLLKHTGAQAVKLEGGSVMAPTVEFLSGRGIPVMGHIGLTPQYINQLGSFKRRGGDSATADLIMADAHAVEQSGAFAVVLEGVVAALAERITRAITIPTIGIAASAGCDGQVLVSEDLLGLSLDPPGFVKAYAQLSGQIAVAVSQFAEDVRRRRFPPS